MAIENVLRVGLADVQRLSFECRKCGAISAWKPTGVWETSCPQCRERWVHPGTDEERRVNSAVVGLRYLTEHVGELPFAVGFEVLAP